MKLWELLQLLEWGDLTSERKYSDGSGGEDSHGINIDVHGHGSTLESEVEMVRVRQTGIFIIAEGPKHHKDHVRSGEEIMKAAMKNRQLRFEGKALTAVKRSFDKYGVGGDGSLYRGKMQYSIPGPEGAGIERGRLKITFQWEPEEG